MNGTALRRYEFRVEGHLDQHWSTWFGGLTLALEEDGTTTLRGVVVDQSALHGLLVKIRDLGLPLISVKPLDGTHDGAPEHHTSNRTPRGSREPSGSRDAGRPPNQVGRATGTPSRGDARVGFRSDE